MVEFDKFTSSSPTPTTPSYPPPLPPFPNFPIQPPSPILQTDMSSSLDHVYYQPEPESASMESIKSIFEIDSSKAEIGRVLNQKCK